MTINVLLVDDHAIFRKGLALLVKEEEDMRIAGEAVNGKEAVDLVRKLSPDVVIMDISMPDMDGIDAARHIVTESPNTKILALSMHAGTRFVEDMLKAGATGYVLKESVPEEMIKAVRSLMRGEVYLSAAISRILASQYVNQLSRGDIADRKTELSAREKEFLQLVAEGYTEVQVAERLCISVKSATSRRRRLMKKLDLANPEELAAYASTDREIKTSASRWSENTFDDSIIRTKLHPPPVTPDLIPRTRLLEQFEKQKKQPLTLVSAPAGYGKSTLASSWLESCNCPGAWYSLDEEDNDLRQFLTYFLAAVHSIFPNEAESTQSLLDAPNLPPIPILTRHLLNDLEEIDEPFILVLDDYHRIREKSVHDLIAGILEHPPKSMHLVLLTRRDPALPLSNLRGRGMVHEVTTGMLRFTAEETVQFFEQALGLAINAHQVENLEKQLEGWAAGMRLIAHSVEDSRDLERILESLPADFPSIFDYLGTEVLSRQPAPYLNLLLETSLFERFCAPLCDAINPPAEGNQKGAIDGNEFLEWLRRTNLFIIHLDQRQHWLRYHHTFQHLLRINLEQSFTPEEINLMHTRASNWFAQQGLFEEAIHHAILAGDMDGAAQIAEENRMAALDDDQLFILQKWLSHFPEEVIQRRPGLLMIRAWVLFHSFKRKSIPPIIEAVESILDKFPPDNMINGEIAFFHGHYLMLQNNGRQSLNCLQSALSIIPEKYTELRGETEISYGLASQMQNQTTEALETLYNLLNNQAPDSTLRKTRLRGALTFMYIISGDLDKAEEENRRLCDLALKSEYEYAGVWSTYLNGLICYHRNDLASAISHFSLAVEKKHILFTRAAVDSMAGLVYARYASGQKEEAESAMQFLLEYAAGLDDPDYTMIAQACRMRLSIMQGNMKSRTKSLSECPPAENMLFWLEIPAVSFCRMLLIEGSRESLKKAEEKLQELKELNVNNHNIIQNIYITVLQALCLNKRHRTEEAVETLRLACDLAEKGNILRPFVDMGAAAPELLHRLRKNNRYADFINRILAAIHTGQSGVNRTAAISPSGHQPLIEPLTKRELETLALLSQGMSKKEIATQLFISPETVKSHLKNIYMKLAVGNRREAVEKAVAVGILAPGQYGLSVL